MTWTIPTSTGHVDAMGFWDEATARRQVELHFLAAAEAWEDLADGFVLEARAAYALAPVPEERAPVVGRCVAPFEALIERETMRPTETVRWTRVGRRGRLNICLAVATPGGVYAELGRVLDSARSPAVSALEVAMRPPGRRHARLARQRVLQRQITPSSSGVP